MKDRLIYSLLWGYLAASVIYTSYNVGKIEGYLKCRQDIEYLEMENER